MLVPNMSYMYIRKSIDGLKHHKHTFSTVSTAGAGASAVAAGRNGPF